MDVDGEKTVDEEAIAEEEFVADQEDEIENPLVYDGDRITVESNLKKSASGSEKEELPGAVGTGDLVPETEPFNNEEALRSENVNSDENPFNLGGDSEKSFGGPSVAPIEDATETIEPTAAPTVGAGAEEGSMPVAESAESTNVAQDNMSINLTSGSEMNSINSSINGSESTNAASSTIINANNMETNNMSTAQVATGDVSQPKKKKTGLIVGIIVAVLLLCLVGGGFAYYLIHESKDRTISDAIVNLMGANARQFEGTLTETIKSESDSSFKSITFSFKSEGNGANGSVAGSMKVDIGDGKNIVLDVSGAYISNDAFYIKIDNFKKVIEEALNGEDGLFGSLSDEEAELIKGVVGAILESVDGEWIKIDSGALKPLGKVGDSYDCMFKAIDNSANESNKNKIIDIYKKHQFIVNDERDNESADGLNYFYVKSDSEEAKAFSEEAEELDFIKDLRTCSENIVSSEDDEDDDEEGEEEDLSLASVMSLGITPWTHELKHLKGTAENDKMKIDMDIKISYEDKGAVTPPDDAKTIEDLMNSANSAIKKELGKQVEKMCQPYMSYGEATYKMCIEQYSKSLEQIDIKDFLSIGGIV